MERRTFRLTVSPALRYFVPVLLIVVVLIGTLRLAVGLSRTTASPVLYLPALLVLITVVLLLWSMPTLGNITVSSSQIVLTGLIRRVRIIERGEIAAVVRVTILYQGRFGSNPTKRLLLVGRDGRGLLLISAAYDVKSLATVLGVPIERAGGR